MDVPVRQCKPTNVLRMKELKRASQIFCLFGVLLPFNLNSYLSHLLYKKYMLTLGNTNQKKKIKMAHTLIVQRSNNANILVYFLPVCFLYHGTVHTIF